MDATVKTIFDEMFKVIELNLFASDFDETCDKINNLARDLWFNRKTLTFKEMSDIKRKVFEIRSKRMDEEYKMECARMDEEFKMESERMHKEFKESTKFEESTASDPSSNNGWWIMEQNRIVNDMNQQMINNTIIQNHIINSMMM